MFKKELKSIFEIETNDITNENANMSSETPAGQMMKVASLYSKQYALDNLVPEEYASMHKSAEINIHDLDYYASKTMTCVQHDLREILKNGFQTKSGFIREPQSIRTAFSLTALIFQTTQNEFHGGMSISHIDFGLAPYVLKSFRHHLTQTIYTEARKYYIPFEEIKKIAESVTTMTEAYDVCLEKLTSLSNKYQKEFYKWGLDQSMDILELIGVALEKTSEDTLQGAEGFIHNLNSMQSRGGNQVVFSSINYGCDTSAEGRLVSKSILKSMQRGLGKGETPIFPINVFQVKEGINYSDKDMQNSISQLPNEDVTLFKTPNFDLLLLACKVTSERLFPNFMFLDTHYNKHPEFDINNVNYRHLGATMGCRTRVFDNLHGEKTTVGRGNLSFTTLNLPRIAIQSKNEVIEIALKTASLLEKPNDLDFVEELIGYVRRVTGGYLPKIINFDLDLDLIDSKYRRCVDSVIRNISDTYIITESVKEFKITVRAKASAICEQLKSRLDYQMTAKVRQFPFTTMNNIWEGKYENMNDCMGDNMLSGTLGLGLVGIHNAIKCLYGVSHTANTEAYDTALEILDILNEVVSEYKEKYNLNYAVLATPAESTAGRFVKADRENYGIIEGVTDKDYYVNSFHVDVAEDIKILDKIRAEAPFHEKTLGGHITYVELDGEAKKNPAVILKIVKAMYDAGIGYGSINHPVDRCRECGHQSVIYTKCPICGSDDISRIRRITGYLVGSLEKWNSSKQAEERDRVKHGK